MARQTILPGFLHSLADAGFVEGRNVAIEYRWAEGRYDRLPILAEELAGRQPAVIVTAGGTPTALAVKAATKTIPIVFSLGSDPVEFGLVKSLARPGANVTGVTLLDVELTGKELQILFELLPHATMIGMLVNPKNIITESQTKRAKLAASDLGLRLMVANAGSKEEIDSGFATLVEQRTSALVVSGDPLFVVERNRIVALANRYAIPTIYEFPQFIAAGGLMSYGTRQFDGGRIVGEYVSRILKGEKPADLPVQQSTRAQFIINLKTAKALGLDVPPSLLARADEVIE
jgi:putative ABC transport system substrate-binding protein